MQPLFVGLFVGLFPQAVSVLRLFPQAPAGGRRLPELRDFQSIAHLSPGREHLGVLRGRGAFSLR